MGNLLQYQVYYGQTDTVFTPLGITDPRFKIKMSRVAFFLKFTIAMIYSPRFRETILILNKFDMLMCLVTCVN